ncbi:F-box/kelch-repeat protein At3g06240-like [Phaseolus vulgaris]|uniref:F-box/kelch-repeat protein At3g06240-like n=1 Tax=Phaseolus vulgaris TaxID=3885 RepID=UPI0035CB9892
MYLWNPSSDEFKIIPPNPIEYIPDSMDPKFEYHGFGYDCATGDYKVIRELILFPSFLAEDNFDYEEWDIAGSWEIYSLRSNSWRKLKYDISINSRCEIHDKFYLEGMCHWLGNWQESYDKFRKTYMVSFDLSNEEWFITPLPPIDKPLEIYDNFNINSVESRLFLFNGSISLISNYYETTTFSISILAEIGKKETWTKLITLGPLPYFSRPIGIGNMSNILFRTIDGKLAWLDLRTHLVEKLDVNAHRLICQLIVYKENLFPTKGINS